MAGRRSGDCRTEPWEFLDASLINKVAAIALAPANIGNQQNEPSDSWLEQLAG